VVGTLVQYILDFIQFLRRNWVVLVLHWRFYLTRVALPTMNIPEYY
jgi:hypothetical protein